MDAADPRDPDNGTPAPQPPAEGEQPGESAEQRRADETAEQPPVDETAPAPGQPVDPWNRQAETVVGGVEPVPPTEPPAGPGDGSGTAVMPTVPSDEDEQRRWSARAQVPPAGPGRTGMREDEEWGAPVGRPPRPVLPILIAVVAVILLVIIGLGLWLALRNRNTPTTPATTAPPVPTAPHTTTAPAPTTAPPTTAPPTTVPASITVPDVSGRTPADAQTLLMSLGITVGTQQVQSSTTVPSGQVIGTSPAVGSLVLPGQLVNLIVSSGPPPTPTPTSS